MSVDEVLRCPSCAVSSKTIILKEKEDNNFLYCVSCKAIFPQNKEDIFFQFFKEKHKVEGTLFYEYKKGIYTNRNFKDLILSSEIANIKLTLKECTAKIMVDIGCGNGSYAIVLEGEYQEYYGFEPSDIPEQEVIEKYRLPKNAILLHYDSTKNLPLHNESIDVVTFIASYDHIPNVENVVKDVYNKLKDNGYLVIVMQNCNFWVRRTMKLITKKQFEDRGGHYHYCFHSPDSLIKEIQSFVNMQVESIRADLFFLPNLPKQLSFLYFNKNIMIFMNFLLRHLFSLLSKRHLGSVMIVVFKKFL